MITLANAPVPYSAFGLSRPDLVGIPSGADLRQLVQAAGYRGIDLRAHGLLGTRQEPVDNLVAHGLWLCGGWIDFPFADSDSGIEHFLQDTSTDLTFDSGHLLLGQGDLELEELLQEIVDGFDGWLVVEQDVVVELSPSRLETLSHRYGVARTGCFATVGELAVAIHDGRLAVDAAIIATTGDRVDDALAPAARRCEAPGGEAGSGHLYPATGSRLPRFGHRSRGNGGRPAQYAIRAGLAPVGDLRPRVRGSDGDQPWETPGRLQSRCRPPRPFYRPGFVKSLCRQRRADNQSCLRSRPTRATV